MSQAKPSDLQSSPIIKRVAILLGKYEAFSSNLEIVAATVAPIYHDVRESLLQQHYWAFAMKAQRLNKREDFPVFGYNFFFDLPPDYIATTYVNNTGLKDVKVIGGTDIFGKKFASDYDPVYMFYTSNVDDESLFTPLFKSAFAYSLAVEACLPVTRDKDLKADLKSQMREFTFEAINTDFREVKYTEVIQSNQYIADRVGVDGSVLGGDGFNAPAAEVQQSTTGIEQPAPQRVANEVVNEPQVGG